MIIDIGSWLLRYWISLTNFFQVDKRDIFFLIYITNIIIYMIVFQFTVARLKVRTTICNHLSFIIFSPFQILCFYKGSLFLVSFLLPKEFWTRSDWIMNILTRLVACAELLTLKSIKYLHWFAGHRFTWSVHKTYIHVLLPDCLM